VNESFLWLVRVRHSQAYTADSVSVVSGASHNATINSLTPGTKYFVSVKCYTKLALFCGLFDYEITATTKKGKL